MTRLLVAAVVLLAQALAAADVVRVAAAISMKDALADVAKSYEAATGDTVEFTLGSSGQLMSQIRNGADVDVFVSAAAKQMDELAKEKLIDATTRRDVAGNALVLIAPRMSPYTPVTSFADLAKAARIAIGEPKSVPAGAYAEQTLRSLKLDAAVANKIVYGTNVRQVLSYIERGDVAAGLVYATDARESGDKVVVIAIAPADSHEPIVYPAAIVANTKNRLNAERFLTFLVAPQAQAALAARGFAPAPSATTRPADAAR